MVRFNYKIESYYKCEQCKHFTQHYNIGHDFIYKVHCGHCSKYDKDINPKTCKCPYFEQVDKLAISSKNKEDISKVLKHIELSLAYIKTYLSKDNPPCNVDNVIIDKLNL